MTSFDILWFDMEVKVRQLMTNLTSPMFDKMFQHEGIMQKIERDSKDKEYRI